MLRFSTLAGCALALCLVFASAAQAQFRGFSFPPALQNMMLLRMEPVQKELELDKDQNTSIGEMAAAAQSEFIEIMSGLQDLSEEERKEEMPNLMKMVAEKGKEIGDKVDKILNDKQKARLKQLSLQRRDADALNDAEVLAVLKFTDEQKKNLEAVREEAGKKQEEATNALLSGGGNQAEGRAKMMALRKETNEKVLAVLTPAQREQFDKMKGEKFNFPQGRGGFGF